MVKKNTEIDELINYIGTTFTQLNQIADTAVPVFEDRVSFIIENEIENSNTVERLLDELLDLAFNDNILLLFKKLCRYYYFLSPNVASYYVHSYFELFW